MASFNEVDSSSYTNVATMVGAEVRNVSRSGRSVTFEYRAYIYQSTSYYTYNSLCLWVEGNKNICFNSNSGNNHSTKETKYYSDWYSKTVDLDATSSSCTIGVGVNGNAWNPSAAAGTVNLTLSGLPTVSKPTVSAPTISNVSDKSAYLSFTDSANNGVISARGVQISTTNFGTVVKSFTGNSGTVTGLDPNRTYYARAYATNEAGTTYSSVKSFTTGFTNPGVASKLSISYDQNEPIPTATYNFKWTAGSAGSKAVAGYRLKIYKNNVEVDSIDTESTAVTYSKTGASLSLAVGDVIKFSVQTYSKDWNNGKHFASAVTSGTITIVSDKYIYASVNGASFDKKKMYISINGGSFVEVKKEKFKVIR